MPGQLASGGGEFGEVAGDGGFEEVERGGDLQIVDGDRANSDRAGKALGVGRHLPDSGARQVSERA